MLLPLIMNILMTVTFLVIAGKMIAMIVLITIMISTVMIPVTRLMVLITVVLIIGRMTLKIMALIEFDGYMMDQYLGYFAGPRGSLEDQSTRLCWVGYGGPSAAAQDACTCMGVEGGSSYTGP